MGDLGSDHEAVISLIINEYKRLQNHNQNHELLRYIENVNENGFDNVKEYYNEFLDKFEAPEDKKEEHIKVVKVLASYYVALREEVDKIERIDKSPKSHNLQKTIEQKLEILDDLPF